MSRMSRSWTIEGFLLDKSQQSLGTCDVVVKWLSRPQKSLPTAAHPTRNPQDLSTCALAPLFSALSPAISTALSCVSGPDPVHCALFSLRSGLSRMLWISFHGVVTSAVPFLFPHTHDHVRHRPQCPVSFSLSLLFSFSDLNCRYL